MSKKNVVVVGGGTGTHTVLRGLKRFKNLIDISAVVTMADSGGSTGRLRDEFGYLPVGDVRMALAALASDGVGDDSLLRELFLYRFEKGDSLSGHNIGNLLLVALTDILGSEEEAIKSASKLLKISGTVLPVTSDKIDLVAEYSDGTKVVGEHEIDEPTSDVSNCRIENLYTHPSATVTPSAKLALEEADLIILGPGDVFTSVLANCVVDGVPEAIIKSKAKIVYVCNLMTKLGQTDNMKMSDHVSEIFKYVGKSPDVVLVNSAVLPKELLKTYAKDNEWPIEIDEIDDLEIISKDFLASEKVKTAKGDVLKRSLIRHDSDKLANQIMKLL
ncbi:MAG: putative cofD-like protein [Candidatus Paceibacteria bacterium]|jgi:uncharacterized cofD-like protein